MVNRAPLPEPKAKVVSRLIYPRQAESSGTVDAVDVDLEDVRAARGIRVMYDFDRDGFIIGAQCDPGESGPDAGCIDGDERYFEVAFVPAWHDAQPENDKAERG